VTVISQQNYERIIIISELFEFSNDDLLLSCTPLPCYSVAPDGERFYAMQRRTPPPLPPVTHINLVLNWFEELKAKVPIK